jgi:hypothetical protein
MNKKMFCKKCNVEITAKSWARYRKSKTHLQSETHLKNDPDQTTKPGRPIKLCKKCNIEVRGCCWTRHLKSKRHPKYNLDQKLSNKV